MSKPSTKYLRIAEVRLRYGGVSENWIARKTDAAGFPAPVYFHGRDRFWPVESLDAWDARAIAAGPIAPVGAIKCNPVKRGA
jgi:predicted DNA-binding transcriptional regulator AlpA